MEDAARVETDVAPALLTVPEVANELRVRPGRAYELLRRKLIPAVRIGRQVR